MLKAYSPSVSQTLGNDNSSSGIKKALQTDGFRSLMIKASSNNQEMDVAKGASAEVQMVADLIGTNAEESRQHRGSSISAQVGDPKVAMEDKGSLKVPNKPKAPWVKLFKENRQQSRGLSLPTFEIEGIRAVLEM